MADGTASTITTPGPIGSLLVESVRIEAEEVRSFELIDPEHAPLPPWQPGAHIDLVLTSGLVRSYSLCGDPDDPSTYRIAVLREPDSSGGSAELHDATPPGSPLGFQGPYNHFELEDAPSYLFLAGGIGIAPILPMVNAVAAAGRPWRLVYRGRTTDSMAFVDEVQALPAENVELLSGVEGATLDVARRFGELTAGTAVYCCGPAGMLDAAERSSWRIGTTSLHTERFHPEPVFIRPEETAFDVRLDRTGVKLHVPVNRSILSVLREVVPDTPYSCGWGGCGVCVTTVLEGVPDHRDRVLGAEQRASNRLIMVCVSRSKTPLLVLDA